MAIGREGLSPKRLSFIFFRNKPFKGTFAIAAGLEPVLDYLKDFQYTSSDLSYLAALVGSDGNPLFEEAFLDYLSALKFSCDIDAMPEGTPVFPLEPLIRVQGPIIQAQLLEGFLLNIINFQSLIATKAARICYAAGTDPVIEFGLRRAQGIDGALSASRGAYIGGACATSNLLAGKLFGIPVKGTHAHSWIMTFEDEEEAFFAWGEAMPNNVIFLVDTYDSIEGTKKAIKVARRLREKNIEMRGVRLDSGDLAYLSIEIRALLDEAGFEEVEIMASNALDEYIIQDLKRQGAKINSWGVGTNLVTGKDQPALDGVYKLSALRDSPNEPWRYKIKISEQPIKITTPGILQVRRFQDGRGYLSDMIYDIATELPEGSSHDLLIPVIRKGQVVYASPSLDEIRAKAIKELSHFRPGIRRFLYPRPYPVELEPSLHKLKLSMIKKEAYESASHH
jgi:nicotinate phosphoribosyltransferase